MPKIEIDLTEEQAKALRNEMGRCAAQARVRSRQEAPDSGWHSYAVAVVEAEQAVNAACEAAGLA